MEVKKMIANYNIKRVNLKKDFTKQNIYVIANLV